VSAASGLNAFWWSWLARPKSDRPLFRLIRKHKPCKLMLLGLTDSVRPVRMISLAQRYHPTAPIEFAGIDRFDSRASGIPGMSLKLAHQLLRPTAARINLIPGDPFEALTRAANTLHGYQLVLISATQNPESLSRAWFYLNRLLAPNAVILREETAANGPILNALPQAELARLATAAAPHRRAA
jgi:hypothetical protein